MGLLFTKTGSELIKGGSMIGNHEISIYHDRIVASDSGGIFASEKTTEAHFNDDNVRVTIKAFDYSDVFNRIFIECPLRNLEVTFYTDLESVQKLFFEADLKQLKLNCTAVKIDGVLRHPSGFTYVGVNYFDKQLKLIHEYGFDDVFLKDIKNIQRLKKNIFLITIGNTTYKVAVNNRSVSLLNQAIDDLSLLHRLGNRDASLELKFKDNRYIGFPKGSVLEIYDTSTLKLAHAFELQNMQLYLGYTYLLIKHNEVLFVCDNSIAKKLCVDLKIVPKKLHQFTIKSLLTKKHNMRSLNELVCYLDEGQWHFYEVSTGKLIAVYLEHEVRVSAADTTVLVLPDGLLKAERFVDFVDEVRTPPIYFSSAGFPLYFERKSLQIHVSVPGDMILEEPVDAFYNRRTKQDGNTIIVYGVANTAICIPLETYRSLFKAHLYDLRQPTLQQVHTEKVLLSRARNMSDLLLFEFFGQWQIILDFVKEKMKEDRFTEQEITQFGLYLYHATFQQRKRMEEIASKYPQFMYALSQDLMVDPRLNQIYQKQQKEMFQLSAQMKSQFTEVESLLSQITYVHFNNDEYQKRLKAAQDAASAKKVGVSVVAGIGIGIATSGISLLIPVMTAFTEWINSGHRKELEEIQREKEFKKNEFLFKKAIDLILHMNDFTINYHVEMLNQFTYKNLRLEAEILATDNTEQYKDKLLKQSIDVYAKTSLPIDYDTQLKPKRLVESILTTPAESTDKTVSLFLE